MINNRLIYFIFVFPFWINSQTKDEFVINSIRNYELNLFEEAISNLNPNQKQIINWQFHFLRNFKIEDSIVKSVNYLKFPNDNFIGDFYYNINLGDYNYYSFLDKNEIALDYYRKSLNQGLVLKNNKLICEALKKILTVHRISYLYDNTTYKNYLELYNTYKYDELENAYYNYFKLILNFKNYDLHNWSPDTYSDLHIHFKNFDNPYLKGISYTVFASYFEELNALDSTWYYINSAEKEFDKIKFNYHKSRLNQLKMFKARIALKEKNKDLAYKAIHEATQTKYNKTDFKWKSLSYFYNSIIDTLNNNYKSAFTKLQKYNSSQDSIREYRYNNLINELDTKYQTSEKEKQNLILQEQKTKNKNIAIGLAGLLLFGSITFVLIQKNTKRKQLLVEQERELETQKLTTMLKEQELTSIDAMIEGQEKERQRIANDLHDDLGGLMANVKMHFNALKDKQSEDLFNKTDKLLDEAYQKVRTVAHAKNSGVIAKQGLLKAVQNMAEKTSANNQIIIEVIDYDLENRFENSLELTLFRVVQELITNVIKHAEATEVTIHITNHEDSLNIMVEDNGKGFNTKSIPKASGMGIHSIDKRIENLGGTVTIESEKNIGTTVIIDIPL